ncbi:MAG: hypothetical protein Q9216_004336 [Gyalolechia sp. 2 TL-2023]
MFSVVAVHGIGAHPDRTWISSHVNWLKDEHMLPAAIPNSRILRFGYESQWLGKDAIQQRLSSVAEQLLRGLMESRKALVSAKLHEEDYPSVIKTVAGIVFLGTPHRGSNSQSKASVIASIASSVALGEHSSLLKVLDKDSEILTDLLHDFTRTVGAIGIPLFCFFEQHKSDVSKVLRFKGAKSFIPSVQDAIVDEKSGCLDGHPKLGLASEHFRLNKFSGPQDSNYRLVCEEIVKMVETAPGRVNNRRKSIPFIQPSPGEYEASDYVSSLSGLTLGAPTTFENRDRASIQALFVTDPADDMQMIANKKDRLLETTDDWILNDTTYRKWLSDPCSRVLWLHGDPGKGKTMLSIALIDELTKRSQDTDKGLSQALLYFFCDNQDDRRGSASLILRGIIYQMLCKYPGLSMYLNSEYEKQREKLFSSPNSIQTLWRIFHSIIKHSDVHEIYIVIDALDECDVASMETLLVLLEPYIDAQEDGHVQDDQDSGCWIRWLLTSRNELRISQPLTGSLDISLEENATNVNKAVFKFIDVKVKQLTKMKHYDEALRNIVEKSLREKAEGTFLWVALACRELSKPSVLSVNTEDVLLELPAGITPLYTRIMDQILTSSDEKSTIYIKSILGSMVVALRPFTLPELAVAAGLPRQYQDKLHVLEEYVQQCGSMVTIRKRQAHFVHLSAKIYLRQAQFIHLSARSHLLENGRGGLVSQDLRPEHRNVATHCFGYIHDALRSFVRDEATLSTLNGPFSGRSRSDKDKVAWLEYPILFWTDHARNASGDIADRFDLATDFFKSESVERNIWFSSFWTKTHSDHEKMPEAFTSMHLAAYAGLSWLILKLCDAGFLRDIHARDSQGNMPLIWAAKNGYCLAVQLLLDKGAEIGAENYEGVTALYWAANNGHAATVDLLLNNGANCKPRDKVGWTSLHRAAFNGHIGVVRTLLDKDADIEATDSTNWTALMRAATTGNTAVTRLLLSKSADPNVRDMEGCTPLHHAAAFGHWEIVRLFLERGSDPEVRDNDRWTALHQAAWGGHEKTVKYLLKKGANIDSKANNGWTAFHQASWNNHRAVVKRLLREGANVNETDDEGETALHQAAWRGYDGLTELLLEKGADSNSRDKTCQTPLHQAASNGSIAVVKLLIGNGADPRAEDREGRKPHSLAEENFHHASAKLLRDRETKMYGQEVLPDLENIPRTPRPGSRLDSAVMAILSVDASMASIEPYGQAGFSTPSKITTNVYGKASTYFMKTGPDGDMFRGEYESLAALQAAVSSFCPRPIAHGKLADSPDYFLLTDFIDIDASPDGQSSGLSLARKLAQLHSTPTPTPNGFPRPVFGFHVATCVGRTLQKNPWDHSWPKFFIENRLRAVWETIEASHGTDTELHSLLDRVIKEVVPRLLGDGHLGGQEGVKPALVHGDLWAGNKARGRVGRKGGIEDVTFDPGSCYAHSEYELGIMRMFGGFPAGFFNEYHRLVPKTQPKSEYDDRLSLYQLYQWLNHYALFSGGYREDAMECMEKLVEKYGENEDEDDSSDLS